MQAVAYRDVCGQRQLSSDFKYAWTMTSDDSSLVPVPGAQQDYLSIPAHTLTISLLYSHAYAYQLYPLLQVNRQQRQEDEEERMNKERQVKHCEKYTMHPASLHHTEE
jgi:hypothetical protein